MAGPMAGLLDFSRQLLSPRHHKTASMPVIPSPHLPPKTPRRTATAPRLFKQGYLIKQGGSLGGFKTWKKRWFVFDATALSYYENEEEYKAKLQPLGRLPVNEKFRIRDTDNWTLAEKTHFTIECSERTMFVKAETPEIKQEWLEVMQVFESEKQRLERPVDVLFDNYNILGRGDNLFMDMSNDTADAVPWQSDGSDIIGRSSPSHSVSYCASAISTDSGPTGATSGSPAAESTGPLSPVSAGSPLEVHRQFSFGVYSPPQDDKRISPETDIIVAATPNQLIHKLTDVSHVDYEFRKAFLLFHPTFMSTEQLFKSLIDAFEIPPSTFSDHRMLVAHRLNILDIIREWTEFCFQDFKKFSPFFYEFISSHVVPVKGLEDGQQRLIETTQKQMELEGTRMLYLPPTPSETASQAETHLEPWDFEAKVLAEQITDIDNDLFQVVHPREFVNKAWSRKDGPRIAPNLLRMVDLFNKRSYWVASEVLSRETVQERAKVLENFIRLASKLLKLNNFFSAFAVVNGLSINAVFRLKSAWTILTARAKSKFHTVKQTITADRNFGAYRRALRAGIGKPQIPHLAVLFKDLCQLDETKREVGPEEVAFGLFQRQWTEIATVLQCKEHSYRIPRNPLCHLTLHTCFDENLDEERMMARSLRFDPKEVPTADS